MVGLFKKIKFIILNFIKLPVIIKNNNRKILEEIRKIEFTECALSNHESLELENIDIIVSLTTYGDRLYSVHNTIKSVITQTVKVNKIILWLSESEFENVKLPLSLINLKKYGLEVRYCKEIRSYKKIIPTMINYPDSYILTIDDDILYPKDMVEKLVNEINTEEKIILACRAHKIKYSRNNIEKYNNWEYETKDSLASHDIFITSGGGTLFPPNCFDDIFNDEDIFLKLSPTADDVWINFNAVRLGIKRKKISDSRCWEANFIEMDGTQENKLSSINVGLNKNDIQIKNVIEYFNL